MGAGISAGKAALQTSYKKLQERAKGTVHDLFDYEGQPFLLGHQNEAKIRKEGLKKGDFDFKKIIGVSTFGHVTMAKHKISGIFVAIKCLNKKEVVRLKQVENIYLEKEVLTFMDHPCVVRCGGAFQDVNTLYLVTELCPGGDLYTLISHQPSRRLDDAAAKFYAAGVAMALSYLHVRDLAYRALNSENVLIDARGYIKITDFQQMAGVVQRPNKGRNEFTKRRLKRSEHWTVAVHPGPELVQKTWREPINTVAFEHMRRRFVPHYFAPEVINLQRHGKETDWWSLGVLVYEMVTGFPPFYDADPPGLYEKILRQAPEFPAYVMPLAKDFALKCLTKDRKHRIGYNGAQDVLKHNWFRNIQWQRFMYRKLKAPLIPEILGPSDTRMFQDFTEEGCAVDDHGARFGTEERTLGDVFEKYSDPEAEPLTHLPPKHLLYYNLGLKMPGGPIEEEEETPRSDDDKDEDLPGGGGSELMQELDEKKQAVVDSFVAQFGLDLQHIRAVLEKHKWNEDKAAVFLEKEMEKEEEKRAKAKKEEDD